MRCVKIATIAVLLAALFLGGRAQAASIEGVAHAASVVWVSGGATAPAAPATMRQTSKTFVPALLVVPIGTSVIFPNDDGFYHSVYSVSPSNPFDLGLYDNGPGKSVSFDNPGVVEVRCHVHGSMHATIVVVDGPYAITTRPDEHYRIDGVPLGSRVVHSWTGGSAVSDETVVVRQRGGGR